MTAAAEHVLFREGSVTVTNARFIVSGQTYVMNGVTSIRSHRQEPSRALPLLLCFFGLVLFIGDAYVWGVAAAAAGLAWLLAQKTQFTVVLSTAAGEQKALTSADRAFVQRIIDALNEAVIMRG